MRKPRVGVSACLLGQRVRYDGDHRRCPFVTGELGRVFAWVAVCPEVEAGFGVPRETLRLEGDPVRPRLVTTGTREDRTEAMEAWCRARVEALSDDLCGFVFKARSPSCGPAGVPLFRESGEPEAVAAGLFARAVRARFPGLPVVDEAALADPARVERFVRSVRDRFDGRRR